MPEVKLGPVLTDKESKDLADKLKNAYLAIFKYVDLAITHTNAEKAPAAIWSMMDDDDLAVFVEVTINGAKKSRILATGVRKVVASYNLLRLGIITAPRFMETVQHYRAHGGFILPWMGGIDVAANPG